MKVIERVVEGVRQISGGVGDILREISDKRAKSEKAGKVQLQTLARKLAAGVKLEASEREVLSKLLTDGAFTEGALRQAVAAIEEFERMLKRTVRFVIKAKAAKAVVAAGPKRLEELEAQVREYRVAMSDAYFAEVAAGGVLGSLEKYAAERAELFDGVEVRALVERHVAADRAPG